MIRSIAVIGSLWPICACGHIAQGHDDNKSCSTVKTGQCPTCNTWGAKISCDCNGYTGPTWEEFKNNYLTQEEIKYYNWESK